MEKTKTLKVKQIAAGQHPKGGHTLYAVVEDGSVWQLASTGDEWIELPEIEVVDGAEGAESEED